MHWLRTLGFYLALTLIALFVGGIAGAHWGLGIALLVIVLIHLFNTVNLGRLHHWLLSPNLDNVPRSIFIWQDIFDRVYEQVRSQQKRREKLAATLERFMQAAEALPDGVIMLDEHARIEWCNPAATTHLGLNGQTDLGEQITNLVRQPILREYLRAEDFSQPLPLRITRPQELLLNVLLVPIDSSRKLLLTRDMTQLDRVQTVHRDFIANVSHELRTPLTVIGGFIETMLDMPDTDIATRAHHLELMHGQTIRMQHLVDDLLTLSRLESGLNLREEEVDMPALLALLLSEARSLSAGQHNIVAGEIMPTRLLASPDEIHSACSNLVSNAVRYTPAGGSITLSWTWREGQPVFAVQDTGLGIAPEHIPRLTERFYRVDRGRSRMNGGTGLGLAIVKHILHRHAGRLVVESQLGQGSEFAAYFPADRAID